MKTLKIITIAFITVFMVSCGTYYRMVTTLDRDGSALREVYAHGDSAFMAGNMSHNPYLFDIHSGWDITRLDSATQYNFFGVERGMTVKVSQSAPSIDSFSKNVRSDEDKRSFTAPEETLTKKFRWFYTNYTFTGVYKKLHYDTPVSIDKYLTQEEQKLWSQGDFSPYKAMNGSEMSEMFSGIEDNFMDWYARNCFEISLNSIKKRSSENSIDADKDKIYKQLSEKEQHNPEDMPKSVCDALDAFYKTNRFSELYKANEEILNKELEEGASIVNLLYNIISYELVVPGKILATNSPLVNAHSLTWKVDGIRILFDDYTLTAEYRVPNRWAFILSGLVLVIAVASTILLRRKKHHI